MLASLAVAAALVLGLAVTAGAVIAGALSRPIRGLAAAVRRIGEGDLASPATPHGGPEAPAVPAVPAELGGLRLDLASHAAIWRGRVIPLDTVEYKLLDYLVEHARAPVPSSKLIEHVWGATGGSEELLRVYVRRLREDLEEDPDRPRVLRTVLAEAGPAYVLESG